MDISELKQKLKSTLAAGWRGGRGLVTGFLASKAGESNVTPSASPGAAAPRVIHREVAYGAGVKPSAPPNRLLPWLLFGSLTAVLASTVTNVLGFSVVFPGKPVMSFLAGVGLESLVITTWLLLAKGSRAGRRTLKKAAALFATASVVFSVAGMLIGANLSQTRQDAGVKSLEAARHAIQVQAEAATEVKQVYEGRVVNELQYIGKTSGPVTDLDNPGRFAQAQVSRKGDLQDLLERWHGFTYADLASARTPEQVWHALQSHYASLQDLVAETRKGTKGPESPCRRTRSRPPRAPTRWTAAPPT